MKNHYTRLSFVLAAGMLTACSQSDDLGQLIEPAPATFSARIGTSASRAAGTEWSAGDAIGISGVSGDKIYRNVEYRTESAAGIGNFAAVRESIYFQTTEDVAFTAYYPYSSDLGSDGILTASTLDQAKQTEFDFLWAQASGSYAAPEVNFNFAHRMSRLTLTFVNGNDVDLSDMTYTIDGLIAAGTFDTATGEAKADGNSAAVTLSAPVGSENRSSLIVFPQVADDVTLCIMADGQTYESHLNLGTLASGSSYNITLSVKKTGLSVLGSTITDWADGGSYEGEATLPEPLGTKPLAQVARGDFYMADGSLADGSGDLTPRQIAGCIGVVFCTDELVKDEGYNAMVVALDEGEGDWHTAMDASSYSVKAPEGSSGWFLPKLNQLIYMCGGNDYKGTDCKDILNEQFARLGNHAQPFGDYGYWTCKDFDLRRYIQINFSNGEWIIMEPDKQARYRLILMF